MQVTTTNQERPVKQNLKITVKNCDSILCLQDTNLI